jgi:hypothetical protein
MPTPERLTWTQMAPEPDEMLAAECGPYVFEISQAPKPGPGYLLQVWQTRPEDWPLVVWEMDGYGLEEAKAERLVDQPAPSPAWTRRGASSRSANPLGE